MTQLNIKDFRLTLEYIKSKLPQNDGYSYYETFGETISNAATKKAIEKIVWGIEEMGFYKDDDYFMEALVKYIKNLKDMVKK